MKDLNTCRQEIDAIDTQIMKLFEQRMKVSKNVIEYKLAHDMEIFQPEREKAVIEKNVQRMESEELKTYGAAFIQDVMDISKSYQAEFIPTQDLYHPLPHKNENIVVGYQGVPGAFGHQAMLQYFGEVDNKNYPLFEDVYKAIVNHEIDYGIVPLENSSTGAINDNYDLVRNYNLYIVGEYNLSISQHLLGIKGAQLEDLKEVYSHPQGLHQCSHFLAKHPQIIQRNYTNTAASAKYISQLQDKTKGAIASLQAAQLYNLDVIQEDIHNSSMNHTRFIVIGRHLEDSSHANVCSIVFTLQHKVGALYSVLKAVKDHQINLSRIESRPIVDKNWQYYFYIDLEGSIHDQNVKMMLQEMKTHCLTMRVLGNYQQAK